MRNGNPFAVGANAANALKSRRQWFAHATASVATLVGASKAHAIRVSEAETSRTMRQQAIAKLPVRQLTPPARQRVMQVVERPTLFRRMPTERIMCHPDLFVFLVRYPEIVVNMWGLMGATKLSVDRVGKYLLDSNDGAGTKTRVELIYGSHSQHLMFADGSYSGPLFRRQLVGKSVLALNSDYSRNSRGEDIVDCTMDVFISLENTGADLVAKTLHPLMGKTADHNFAESARFVSQVSEQVQKNPSGMQRLSRRLNAVEPSIREQFTSVIQNMTNAPPLAADLEPDTRVTKAPVAQTPTPASISHRR